MAAQWRLATVTAIRAETARTKTFSFDVSDWPGHRAGQHIDLRLTAEDGYVAQRSYSIASAPHQNPAIELTIDAVPDGEVSGFLHDDLLIGDQIELRGPIGGYFTWEPAAGRDLLLVAGGSGIVPLMAMLRTRAETGQPGPARLLYSSRGIDEIIFRAELEALAERGDGLAVTHTLTRNAPLDWMGERGRIGRVMLARNAFQPVAAPDVFVCGPTPFVEAIADHLIAMGHDATRVRTERFGPTGEVR